MISIDLPGQLKTGVSHDSDALLGEGGPLDLFRHGRVTKLMYQHNIHDDMWWVRILFELTVTRLGPLYSANLFLL